MPLESSAEQQRGGYFRLQRLRVRYSHVVEHLAKRDERASNLVVLVPVFVFVVVAVVVFLVTVVAVITFTIIIIIIIITYIIIIIINIHSTQKQRRCSFHRFKM